MSERFSAAMARLPLIAILRGLTPAEAPAILDALTGAGFTLVEVPLNSPSPFESIRIMRAAAPADVLVGAGTVRTLAEVEAVEAAGGELVISPHCDVALIRAARARGLIALPGVATPSEAFAALDAGANGLKAFPAEMIAPIVLKSWRAVLPRDVPVMPVGGIAPASMAAYVAAGAAGFGLGSALYRPGDDAARVRKNAEEFVAAWRAL